MRHQRTAAPLPRHVIERRGARQSQLRRLGYRTYADYLRSPHWRSVRRAYRESGRSIECGMCRSVDALELHHKTYERLGAEQLDDLVLLCDDCHSSLHVLERRGDASLDPDDLRDPARAARNAEDVAQHRALLRREVKVDRQTEVVDDLDRALREAYAAGVDTTPIEHALCRMAKALDRRTDVARQQ